MGASISGDLVPYKVSFGEISKGPYWLIFFRKGRNRICPKAKKIRRNSGASTTTWQNPSQKTIL
jgi:hypothetical protein